MTRAYTTAALALLLAAPVLTPARAQADETIRIAILQNAELATVVSSAGLIVQAQNDTVDATGQIIMEAGPSGLTVDGQLLRSNRLEVRGRDGELTINGLTVGGRVIVKRQNGKLLAINEVPLEDDVKGVVPTEKSAACGMVASLSASSHASSPPPTQRPGGSSRSSSCTRAASSSSKAMTCVAFSAILCCRAPSSTSTSPVYRFSSPDAVTATASCF